MARSRSDELLEGWKMVARSARRPATAPRRQISRNGLSAGTLVAVVVAIVVIIAISSRGSSPAPQPTLPAVGASPSAVASPSANASATSTSSPVSSPEPSTSAADAAASIVHEYTDDLVKGNYSAAWALLAPDAPTRSQTFAAWSSERRQFFVSVGTLFTIVVSPPDVAPMSTWLASPWSASIDVAHALLVEVDYPALIRNNAGYELYIVNPTATGLEIYDVR